MASDDIKAALNEQIHAGRRQKLRDRFLRHGLANWQESEVLEFALGFGIPRLDTNPAAHGLLNMFGSLRAVVDANPTDLALAYGMGENAAIFLNFLKEFGVYLAQQTLKQTKVDTPYQAACYLQPMMKLYAVEQFVIVCIDFGGNVKTVQPITTKEFNQVHLSMREIVSLVLASNAAKVLIAHNHLNGDPLPSRSDMQITRKLAHLFYNLDIKFLDHLIFAGEEHYSFVTSGIMDIFKKEAAHAQAMTDKLPDISKTER